MKVSFGMRAFSLLLIGVFSFLVSAHGQVPTTLPQAPTRKPTTPVRAVGPIIVEGGPVAPQVVTVLHRLNGLKLFRLMARKDQQLLAIAQLDEAFKILGDVHTNVIAGLTLDDGVTIVARLPEVEAELGPSSFNALDSFYAPGLPPPPVAPAAPRPAIAAAQTQPKDADRFDEPDVTVIARDGRRFFARYVGLDGETGLSILKLTNKSSLPAVVGNVDSINVGQHLRLFGPEPTTPTTAVGVISVRVGETDGTITNIVQAPAGGVWKMKIRSARLTQANIGGVAVNDAGETVGIVDNIERGEANLLSTAQIKNAARRVLARQASVPRPWLGVSGEPIATLGARQLLNNGWRESQALALTQDRYGILLTAVAPDSPASTAALRSGDVILRVNGEDIRTAEEFSRLLGEAGAGGFVSFTVMRPGQNQTDTVNLKLSGAFSQGFPGMMVRGKSPFVRGGLLIQKGIETVALKPAVAARLGATGGLLVIYVQPESEAFEAGLRPGDVIQAINGQPVSNGATGIGSTSDKDLTFEVVRGKQKLKFTVVNTPK